MAGVDGFRGRWLVATVEGRSVRFAVAVGAGAVLGVTARCRVVAVDVPMGLAVDGVRSCEQQARDELGSARSSIFPTPPRSVLGHVTDWVGASAAARAASGKGISKQSFHILPGIKAFDTATFDRERVVETHPELSFRAMTGPEVTFVSKKTARGQGQRIAALSAWCDIDEALREVPDGPAMDDVLDAVACAWSARRWAERDARVLGGELDPLGKPMRIVI